MRSLIALRSQLCMTYLSSTDVLSCVSNDPVFRSSHEAVVRRMFWCAVHFARLSALLVYKELYVFSKERGSGKHLDCVTEQDQKA